MQEQYPIQADYTFYRHLEVDNNNRTWMSISFFSLIDYNHSSLLEISTFHICYTTIVSLLNIEPTDQTISIIVLAIISDDHAIFILASMPQKNSENLPI